MWSYSIKEAHHFRDSLILGEAYIPVKELFKYENHTIKDGIIL